MFLRRNKKKKNDGKCWDLLVMSVHYHKVSLILHVLIKLSPKLKISITLHW